MDMHPDVFSAAATAAGSTAADATFEWVHDREETVRLERWVKKFLREGDTVVLEASGNSFDVAKRLRACGINVVVLESAQAAKVKHNFCNDDRQSAQKLARVYLSGLAKEVWQPDEKTLERREVFFAHRNAVKDSTRWRNRIKSFLSDHGVRLKVGTVLTREGTEKTIIATKAWTLLQGQLIVEMFTGLRETEAKRKRLEKVMVKELIGEPQWSQLWRLSGIRHRVAFGLMAMIGTIERFETAKKLVGYFGLAPKKDQSGNDVKGVTGGIGNCGRKDIRSLLLQSAQNALTQRGSPLHKWGWKLLVKKNRNIAAAAVARKLTVSIWYLLKGRYNELSEAGKPLEAKLLKLATLLGLEELKVMKFENRTDFLTKQIYAFKTLSA